MARPTDRDDRRRVPRQETNLLHISVTLTAHGVELEGEILDLSTHGARVRLGASALRAGMPPFSPEAKTSLGLSTNVDPEPLYLPAVVRWTSGGTADVLDLDVGFEFADSDEDARHALSAFVEIAQNAEHDLEQGGGEPDESAEDLARAVVVPAGVSRPVGTEESSKGPPTRSRSSTSDAFARASERASLAALFDKRVLLIAGKGGVGRTTVAAALAHAAARTGRRVLLCDIGDPKDGQCPLAQAVGKSELTADPLDVAPGVQACHLWARQGHELFFQAALPVRSLVKVAVGSRFLRVFLEAAPSFEEMGVFYHLLTLLREREPGGRPRHELIIIDMPATGHALALTGLPRILLRLIPGGPIVRLLEEGRAYLNDSRKSAACVVTLPETLPVSEALELLAGMKQTDMFVGGVVLNRQPENPFSADERAVVEELLGNHALYGSLSYRRMVTARAAYERLVAATDVPILTLPERAGETQALVQQLARDIEAALRAT